MDNDNKLISTLKEIVKEGKLRWETRGLPLLSASEGNDWIRESIRRGEPFFAGRCGATEMRTTAEFLAGNGFTDKARREIRELSGVFPTDDALLKRFCQYYMDCAGQADLLALWGVGAERRVISSHCDAHTRFTRLRALEPYYHADPWSAALSGKKVLVVHPFARTIRAQYARREQLFPDTEILPEFASLTVVQAVQGLAGQDTGFPDWFAALKHMEAQMDSIDYQVAILGAGAYSLPLAAHAKATGHMAVQMSGSTQLLFGIKGKRWDNHPEISLLYNEAWVRPGADETPECKEKVEGGSYW